MARQTVAQKKAVLRVLLAKEVKALADARDRLRSILDEYTEILDASERAADALDECVDALSERV